MKQTILGFNQEASVKLGLTIKDLLLLQYVAYASMSDSMKTVFDEDGIKYVWLQRTKIIEDLPILNIKERELNYSINRLKELGLLQTKDIRESGVRGSCIYYGVTEKCKEIMCEGMPANTTNARVSVLPAKNCTQSDNTKDMTAKNCTQSDVLPAKNCNQNDQLGAKNCTSDNKINSNNSTKVELGKSKIFPHPENSQPKRRVLVPTDNPVSNQPAKKKNKYQNCMDITDEIFTDVELRKILSVYLPVRLAMKNKPIFASGWKLLLERLRDMTSDNATRIKIVQQSIDNGWGTFVELKRYNYNKRQKFAEGKNGLKLGRNEDEEIINETF